MTWVEKCEDLKIDLKKLIDYDEYGGNIILSFFNDSNILEKFGDVLIHKVNGNFSCNSNDIISLKGSPYWVGGNFSCSNNLLDSFEGVPKYIGGDLICHQYISPNPYPPRYKEWKQSELKRHMKEYWNCEVGGKVRFFLE